VKITNLQGKLIDVLDEKCLERNCFVLGFDKGSFSQGRGYISYHAKIILCCQTRLVHGCPLNIEQMNNYDLKGTN